MFWGKVTQARETGRVLECGGRAAVNTVAPGDGLSGESTSEQRWKGARGRHPDTRVGGDASRKRQPSPKAGA